MKDDQLNETVTVKKISCKFCASRCGMLLHATDEKVAKIEGDPQNPVSRGWTCNWGKAAVIESYNQNLRNA